MASNDYASAILDAVGIATPGFTDASALSKTAERLVAKYGDGIGKFAASQLKSLGAELHHLFTNKNKVGGFTKQFGEILEGAGLSFNSPEVLIPLLGHKGRHAAEYWDSLLKGVKAATEPFKKGSKDYADAVKQYLKDEAAKLIQNPELLKGN